MQLQSRAWLRTSVLRYKGLEERLLDTTIVMNMIVVIVIVMAVVIMILFMDMMVMVLTQILSNDI